MNDIERKALVERMREGVDNDGYDFLIEMADADMREAADLIEAQAAEIERLEALFTNSTYEAKAMMEEIDRRGAEIQALREMQGKDSRD